MKDSFLQWLGENHFQNVSICFVSLNETTLELEKEQQRFFFPSKRDFHLEETKVKIPYMFRLENGS